MRTTSEITGKIQSPPSVEIADKVRDLVSRGVPVAQMQTGEPHFGTPRYIIESAARAMQEGYTHYTHSQGVPQLRKKISEWYGEESGENIPPDSIIITQGAVHAIYCAFRAVLDAGDEVIVPEPFWPQYGYMARLCGADVVAADTSSSRGRLVPEILEKLVSEKTKVLIINNPSNPAGIVYSKKELRCFMDIAARRNFFILFDEVYGRITYTEKFCGIFHSGEYAGARDSVIYVNSFSKTFAMTGWRIGYAVLPDLLIGPVLKVSQNTVTSVNTFVQMAACGAICGIKENRAVFASMLDVYRERRETLMKLLRRKKMDFIEPEGAFYFFISCGRPSLHYCRELLDKERIAAVPGAAYGKKWDEYYRISFAVDDGSFQKFCGWLEK
jgi:aspartate aminotransferase